MKNSQTTPKTLNHRRRWFRLAAVGGSTFLALLVAEFAVFLSGVNNDYRSLRTSVIIPRDGGPYELVEHGFVPHATLRTQYPTDPRGYFDQEFGIDHVFNSEGWRDSEHALQKRPGEFRILGLGDSYLFGQGVKPEDLCLTRLREVLSERLLDRQVTTINTGQSGYNSAMEKRLLERRGLDYEPDLVLLAFVPNDVEPDVYSDRPKVEFLTEFTASYVEPDWLARHSDLWMLTRRKLLYLSAGKAYLRQSIDSYLNDPDKWRRCRDSILAMRDLCQNRDCRFAVVVFPFFIGLNDRYPFQPIHDQVRSFCQKSGIPVLDLRDSYRAFDGPELWVHPTDQHPNEQAHRIAGEVIAEFLISSEILDPASGSNASAGESAAARPSQ